MFALNTGTTLKCCAKYRKKNYANYSVFIEMLLILQGRIKVPHFTVLCYFCYAKYSFAYYKLVWRGIAHISFFANYRKYDVFLRRIQRRNLRKIQIFYKNVPQSTENYFA